jgi:hypothetical protein
MQRRCGVLAPASAQATRPAEASWSKPAAADAPPISRPGGQNGSVGGDWGRRHARRPQQRHRLTLAGLLKSGALAPSCACCMRQPPDFGVEPRVYLDSVADAEPVLRTDWRSSPRPRIAAARPSPIRRAAGRQRWPPSRSRLHNANCRARTSACGHRR